MSKVFIVSGASKGIGAAVTRHLLAHKHKVVLTARSRDLLEGVKAAHPGQVEYVAGDMADPTVRRLFLVLFAQSQIGVYKKKQDWKTDSFMLDCHQAGRGGR